MKEQSQLILFYTFSEIVILEKANSSTLVFTFSKIWTKIYFLSKEFLKVVIVGLNRYNQNFLSILYLESRCGEIAEENHSKSFIINNKDGIYCLEFYHFKTCAQLSPVLFNKITCF